MNFNENFHSLTAFSPMQWQRRLYEGHFARGEIPGALDLPTGLGKTSVMAIWLIARAAGMDVPRRLVYVVDRRAVVDQATAEAEKLRKALEGSAKDLKAGLELTDPLPVSTLRGRFVDNREWLADPASPAIIVGTVDMIGSRILFEGYGVSRRMPPYHAGLLGTDTLIVLDEAHLVPTFEKLLEQIERDRNEYGPAVEEHGDIIQPMRLLSLSATGRNRDGEVFRLEAADHEEDIVDKRVNARKALSLHYFESGNKTKVKLEDELAKQAWALADDGKNKVRILIYCNSRNVAEKTKDAIENLAKGDKKKNIAATQIDTELFTGARRFREREDAAERLKNLGFIAGDNAPLDKPAFLVATSAAEVGVDLDADHMVCDVVEWERMVQRLGRVNRRGEREDTCIKVVVDENAIEKEKNADKKARLEAVITLLGKLPEKENTYDTSPAALGKLKDDAQNSNLIAKATTPAPLYPALTRPLVDAWSMTSLEKHTGRPEIAPWLRGWVEDSPQTEILWRAHLPWRDGDKHPHKKEVKDFFDAAPPHVTEILETYTSSVVDMLVARTKELKEGATKSTEDSAGNAGLVENSPAAIILSRAGEMEKTYTLAELAFMGTPKNNKAKYEKDKLFKNLTGRRVIVPRLLGGLSNDGLLDNKAKEPPITIDEGWDSDKLKTILGYQLRKVGPDESRKSTETNWRQQYRFDLGTEDTDKGTIIIESWRGEGSPHQGTRAISRNAQSLAEHHDWTGEAAKEIAHALNLPEAHRHMLIAAARLHDQGKDRKLWQDVMGANPNGRPWAKTTGRGNGRTLNNYRHEFGSLKDAENSNEIGTLPDDLRDLALHLIAAHHGYARPVIAAIDPDQPPSLLQNRAQDVALRYARLQKQWGPWGLAWWEAALRAADWRASKRNDEFAQEENVKDKSSTDKPILQQVGGN